MTETQKRRKKGESDEDFIARGGIIKSEPSAEDRINNLEKGMQQLMGGMNAIMDRLEAPSQTQEVKQMEREHIDLPPAEVSLGEIIMRRDIAEFLQARVDYLNDTKQRQGWTINHELEHIVKKVKKSASTAAAAIESQHTTLSGDKI